MKALPTQFDRGTLTTAVATPTCSSCCCCCCCLATTIASSSLLARRISKEGTRKKVAHAQLYTTLAALYLPAVALVMTLGFWLIEPLRMCWETTYMDAPDGFAYTVCAPHGTIPLTIVVVGAPLLVLWFLYKRVMVAQPLKRAVLVTLLIALCFGIELVAGAALILSTAGIAYVILVPIAVTWINVWYKGHIGKEFSDGDAVSDAAPIEPILPE